MEMFSRELRSVLFKKYLAERLNVFNNYRDLLEVMLDDRMPALCWFLLYRYSTMSYFEVKILTIISNRFIVIKT